MKFTYFVSPGPGRRDSCLDSASPGGLTVGLIGRHEPCWYQGEASPRPSARRRARYPGTVRQRGHPEGETFN